MDIAINLDERAETLEKVLDIFKEREDAKTEREAICTQIETLDGLRSASGISAFQTFVGKLWDPAKDEVMTDSVFQVYWRQFLSTRIPRTCSI